jgi:hypothetical protein
MRLDSSDDKFGWSGFATAPLGQCRIRRLIRLRGGATMIDQGRRCRPWSIAVLIENGRGR